MCQSVSSVRQDPNIVRLSAEDYSEESGSDPIAEVKCAYKYKVSLTFSHSTQTVASAPACVHLFKLHKLPSVH